MAVFEQLAKAGADLRKATETLHYAYMPGEDTARRAASEITAAGHRCEVRPAATGADWLVLARVQIVPSPEHIEQLRDWFEDLAGRLGGQYDGWEAAVAR